jgi:hypothetical protein
MESVLETPIEKVSQIKIVGFKVYVNSVILGQQAVIGVSIDCICDNKTYVEFRDIVMKDADYLAWGTDDNYIIEFVKSKLADLI